MVDATKNKRFFYINSVNRIGGSSAAFSIALQMPTHEQYDACVITQASIPISYYLISTGYNTFKLTENTTTVTITIPVGNYNINSFCTIIPTLLNANSPNNWIYTMTYNSGFTTNNSGLIQYTVSGNSSQPILTFLSSNFVNEQFGFPSNSSATFSSNTLVSSVIVSFVNEQIIYIHSDIVSNTSDDILQEIYGANSQQLSVITYQCPEIVSYSKKFKGFSNQMMNIYLTDAHGIPLDLNGQDIQFTLLCYKSNMFYDTVTNFIEFAKTYIQHLLVSF